MNLIVPSIVKGGNEQNSIVSSCDDWTAERAIIASNELSKAATLPFGVGLNEPKMIDTQGSS